MSEVACICPLYNIAVIKLAVRAAAGLYFSVYKIYPARTAAAVKFVKIIYPLNISRIIQRREREFKGDFSFRTYPLCNVKNTLSVSYFRFRS